jgi:hypothetical protein
MSRYEIPIRDSGLSAVVGWDNPLQSFFAQVLKPEITDEDEDNVLLWVGTEPREVITVEDLARHLAPFGDLAPQMAEQLRADRAAKLGQAPTALQQASLAVVRRAR